jgi:hypothetical protein
MQDMRSSITLPARLLTVCRQSAPLAAPFPLHSRRALLELSVARVRELSHFERPLPVMTNYDALLGQEVGS